MPESLEKTSKETGGEVEKKAKTIREKRLEGKEPGCAWAETDQMLLEHGIKPCTPEAEEFMKKWDIERARKELAEEKALAGKPKEEILQTRDNLEKENFELNVAITESFKPNQKEEDSQLIEKSKEIGHQREKLRKMVLGSAERNQEALNQILDGLEKELQKLELRIKFIQERRDFGKKEIEVEVLGVEDKKRELQRIIDDCEKKDFSGLRKILEGKLDNILEDDLLGEGGKEKLEEAIAIKGALNVIG